jgi:hypothetical protein
LTPTTHYRGPVGIANATSRGKERNRSSRDWRFERAFHPRQRRFYAIEAIIQTLRENTVLVGHHYQLHGDQEDASFKQETVAEALDEKSDDEQNERCENN